METSKQFLQKASAFTKSNVSDNKSVLLKMELMIVAIFWLINLLVLNMSALKASILILRETVYL